MDNINYEPGDDYTKTQLEKSHAWYRLTEYTKENGLIYVYCFIDGIYEPTEKPFICSDHWLIYIDYVDKTFIIRPFN